MKNIIFRYCTKEAPFWQELEMDIKDYFDLEDNEILTIDSVSKYWHLYDYLNAPLNNLLFIHVIIQIDNSKREFNQTFWNEGFNFIIERIDSGVQNYRELIISSLINKDSNQTETIRLVLDESRFYPIYHGFISQDSNLEEKEFKIDLELYQNMWKEVRS